MLWKRVRCLGDRSRPVYALGAVVIRNRKPILLQFLRELCDVRECDARNAYRIRSLDVTRIVINQQTFLWAAIDHRHERVESGGFILIFANFEGEDLCVEGFQKGMDGANVVDPFQRMIGQEDQLALRF